MAGVFQTGLEPLLEKIATPQRMQRLQALANHPSANPNEANVARMRMQEMQSRGLPAPGVGAQAAQAAQPGYTLNPNEMAQAQRLRQMGPDQRRQALGLHVPDATGAAAAQAAAKPGLMRRGLRGLGVAGLAAGAAGIYGAMNRHEADVQRDGLVYAPMQGMG